jgi:hypothetical protein
MQTKSASPQSPKLLDQVRGKLRVKHHSIRTKEAYADWIKRFILFHDKRPPSEMAAPEVVTFLTDIAITRKRIRRRIRRSARP